MLIASSLEFADDEKNLEKLSINYNQYYNCCYLKYHENLNLTYRFPASDFYIRDSSPSFIDYIICIWVLGLSLRECKKLFIYGARDYLFSWNNVLVSITHLLFICSYALKYYKIIIVGLEKEKLKDPNFWQMIKNESYTIHDQEEIYQTFYWLNEGIYLRNTFKNLTFLMNFFV